MSRVLTNKTSLEYSIEASLGVLAGTPTWKLVEPNTISAFGATITTVSRNPISKNRQRQKGTTTDLDSSVEFEGDLTLEHFTDFVEGFVFAKSANDTIIQRRQAGANFDNLDVTGDAYTHDALANAFPVDTLVYGRGFTNAASNGLKEVATGSTTTTTEVEETLGANETPTEASGATLELAGRKFTDLTWTDATNSIGSALVDLTTLGLSLGQFIQVGNSDGNEFTGGSIRGRITAITAANITLDKVLNVVLNGTAGTLDGGGDVGASTVDVLFGRFVRNVSVDDADFIERSFQFEGAFPDLGGVGVDEYEYAIGNLCNQIAFSLPLTDKAVFTPSFVGTNSDDITGTRKTNADTPVNPNRTTAMNTSSDIARLRITDTSETVFTVCFKSLTLTLANNVSPEKCLGTLGATFMNTGNFDVNLEAQLVFTSKDIPNAIKNNTTLTFDSILKNEDGGIFLDIPSLTLGGGGKEFPLNESVLINITGESFDDATFGTSLGVSLFPFLPA